MRAGRLAGSAGAAAPGPAADSRSWQWYLEKDELIGCEKDDRPVSMAARPAGKRRARLSLVRDAAPR